MASRTQEGVVADRRLNSIVAFAFGTGFVLTGLAGFAVTGGHHAVGPDGGLLLGLFQVNILHNLVHLVTGAAMIAAGIIGTRPAKAVNTAFGLAYLALFLVGILIVGSGANLIALNGADNVLHLALGAALTAVGVFGDADLR